MADTTLLDRDAYRDALQAATEAARRRLLVAGAVPGFVLGIPTAVLVAPLIGLAALVVFGFAGVLWARSLSSGAAERVAATLGAREIEPDDALSFRNALEGVALQTGVDAPRLRLLDRDEANALCAADGDGVEVVATRGLIDGARTVELEVLSAELLCRVRDGSTEYATLAAALPSWAAGIAGLTPARVAATLGEHRACRTDLDAVAVTRYPPGLIATLERMSRAGTEIRGATPATAALWLAPALGSTAGVDPSLDRTVNQPLDLRISVLQEL